MIPARGRRSRPPLWLLLAALLCAAPAGAPPVGSAAPAQPPVGGAAAVPAPGEGTANAPRWKRTAVRMRTRDGAPPEFSVELSWTPVEGAAGYLLLRQRAGEAAPAILETVRGTRAVDEGVAAAGTYTYFVQALDDSLRESSLSVGRTVRVAAETAGRVEEAPPVADGPAATVLWRVGNDPAGAGAPGRAGLGDPFDAAYDAARDRLYVSSASRRQIVVLRGADGTLAGTLGPALGEFELGLPLGLALDGKGTLFVVDQAGAGVVVIGADGRARRRLAVPRPKGGRPPRLIDAAALPDGRLVVSDAANAALVVLGSEGKVLARWSPAPPQPGALGAVAAVAATAAGGVAAADAAAGAIRVYSGRGAHLSSTGRRGAGAGEFAALGGFAPVAGGRFLVADLWRSSVALLGADGAARQLRLVTPGGEDAGGLVGPVNLAAGADGLVFVVEGVARRVTALRLEAPAGPAAPQGAQ